ncbi:MAG: DUF2382 domain-containing protein [Janthinobacterium lividum]
MLQQPQPATDWAGTPAPEEGATLSPLIEEKLEVSKHIVETGKLRLQKSVEAYDVTLDEPLEVNT